MLVHDRTRFVRLGQVRSDIGRLGQVNNG